MDAELKAAKLDVELTTTASDAANTTDAKAAAAAGAGSAGTGQIALFSRNFKKQRQEQEPSICVSI
jgi:hypothetical protein